MHITLNDHGLDRGGKGGNRFRNSVLASLPIRACEGLDRRGIVGGQNRFEEAYRQCWNLQVVMID